MGVELQDVGFIEVVINNEMKRLDLWEVNNRLFAIGHEHRGKAATEYHAAVAEYIKQLGFPECSHWLADQFVLKITGAVNALKNSAAGESKPGSPASTAPQSSLSGAPTS